MASTMENITGSTMGSIMENITETMVEKSKLPLCG